MLWLCRWCLVSCWPRRGGGCQQGLIGHRSPARRCCASPSFFNGRLRFFCQCLQDLCEHCAPEILCLGSAAEGEERARCTHAGVNRRT